jgi:hypothetical protein
VRSGAVLGVDYFVQAALMLVTVEATARDCAPVADPARQSSCPWGTACGATTSKSPRASRSSRRGSPELRRCRTIACHHLCELDGEPERSSLMKVTVFKGLIYEQRTRELTERLDPHLIVPHRLRFLRRRPTLLELASMIAVPRFVAPQFPAGCCTNRSGSGSAACEVALEARRFRTRMLALAATGTRPPAGRSIP